MQHIFKGFHPFTCQIYRSGIINLFHESPKKIEVGDIQHIKVVANDVQSFGWYTIFFNRPNMFRKSLLLVKHPRKSYTNPLGHMSIYVHACPGANEHEMPSLLDLPTSLGRWHPPQKRPRISQATPPG